ncbi:heparinase II/III domain-containing protein [Nonlabens xiamenensis]|uniref:heparinase II/III domain-containing protein n=1 Tax=Nonlabens xiamenensis TaxID=2341043 RepID=UPI000F60E8D6|nr:heparinase II/III family protein [Nonlabens xiamenensis]
MKKLLLVLLLCCCVSCQKKSNDEVKKDSTSSENDASPQLLLTKSGIEAFRQSDAALLNNSTNELKRQVNRILKDAINIPLPKDAGGGYTHEQHKKNYASLYQLAISHRLTADSTTLAYIKKMLKGYADLYPQLPLHPKAKENHPPGKLYWQGLNEAVSLFYIIQAYDLSREFMTPEERKHVEDNLLRPMADFLSVDSYDIFNKIHNHGTWSVAAVGMTGMVLKDDDMVERAIRGSNKDAKTGFLAQLDQLFSADGFYAEGPYYHRYAILPFIAFAKAIQQNRPEEQIFSYRDSILQKAVKTLLQLTDEQGRFYPINDAIKSKTWDSPEVLFATNIAYAAYEDPTLLPVIKHMGKVSFTDAGAQAAANINSETPIVYDRPSQVIRDGVEGNKGGIALLRSPQFGSGQLQAVFKFSTQGMGHGHFDRLSLSVYDHGEEIIPDYGAARFLNIEAKRGGRYLPENKSYARHSIAHSTVVLNERSHYNAQVENSEDHASILVDAQVQSDRWQSVTAIDSTAYDGSDLKRSLVMINDSSITHRPFIIDFFEVTAEEKTSMDLNYPFEGDIIHTGFDYTRPLEKEILGVQDGYQHLEVLAKGQPKDGTNFIKFTFLQAGRFYTISSLTDQNTEIRLTQTGALDPEFNLNSQRHLLLRQTDKVHHNFVTIIEPHGFFDPINETVGQPEPTIRGLSYERQGNVDIVSFEADGKTYLYVKVRENDRLKNHRINYNKKTYTWEGPKYLIKIP